MEYPFIAITYNPDPKWLYLLEAQLFIDQKDLFAHYLYCTTLDII